MEDFLKICALILFIYMVYLYMKKHKQKKEVREGQAKKIQSTCGR